jgi:hypothetical protein
VVHPGAPTEPLPASHLVIGRTVGDPLARRGHFAYRLRADGAHTPWTSQHVSVVSLQMLQAMLAEDIAPLVGPKGHHNPDRTAPRRGSEVGRGDPWRPPGVDQRALVRFGSVPPWSSGDPGGHERSRRVQRNDRSPHLHARTSVAGARPKRFEYDLMAAAGRRPLPTRVVSPWTGLTPCPRWSRRQQVGAAVVLTGRAISVPFRARRLWFTAVSHGHS